MYGTLEGFRAYALERGDSAPTDATDADATAAMVRATDYVDMFYVSKFKESCQFEDAPDSVINATYIAAGLELATPNFFSKTYTPSQQKVLTKVDSIQWTPVSSSSVTGSAAFVPVSSQIDALLGDCVAGGLGGGTEVSGLLRS